MKSFSDYIDPLLSSCPDNDNSFNSKMIVKRRMDGRPISTMLNSLSFTRAKRQFSLSLVSVTIRP